jgi:hypothetical protein
LFNAAMVLLQLIIQIAVRAMAHLFPPFRFDGAGIGVMPIGSYPLWHTTGDGPYGAEERFGRRSGGSNEAWNRRSASASS